MAKCKRKTSTVLSKGSTSRLTSIFKFVGTVREQINIALIINSRADGLVIANNAA